MAAFWNLGTVATAVTDCQRIVAIPEENYWVALPPRLEWVRLCALYYHDWSVPNMLSTQSLILPGNSRLLYALNALRTSS